MNKIIQTILKTNINGQISGANIGGGITIAGSPGIGKTQTMYQIAKDLNMKVLQVSIPEVSTEILSGLPNFIDAPHMDKYSVSGVTGAQGTTWTVPEIIESANRLAEEDGVNGCILFIDDLHRVNMSVAPYLYGLLGERKLGNFKLSPKVAIMGAMNDSDEAGFSGLDSPIKDRIGILPVSFDFDYWFKNFGSGLNYLVASFLKTHPQFVLEPETTMIEQGGSPRSWTHLANEFSLYEEEFIEENVMLLAKQKVSISAAQALTKHITYIRAINFESKVKNRVELNIDDLKVSDQILYAYIINAVDTVADAAYVVGQVNKVTNGNSFIGFIAGELYSKYLMKQKGSPVTKGTTALICKLMGCKPTKEDNFSPKEMELFDNISLTKQSEIMQIASSYVN